MLTHPPRPTNSRRDLRPVQTAGQREKGEWGRLPTCRMKKAGWQPAPRKGGRGRPLTFVAGAALLTVSPSGEGFPSFNDHFLPVKVVTVAAPALEILYEDNHCLAVAKPAGRP